MSIWDEQPSIWGKSTRKKSTQSLKLKPLKLTTSSNNKPKKRSLGIKDKQILYKRAKQKCEACGKKIDFDEMQAGHKKAASKGGNATLANSVCICARCNKLQGTDSWATFMRKMGKTNTRTVTSVKYKKIKKKKTKKEIKSKETNPFELKPLPPLKW